MSKLRLEKIELREIEMPLRFPFETSFGVTTARRILLARVWDKSGADGWGECTAFEKPFYNHETVATAWTIIGKFIAPMLCAARITNAVDVPNALSPIKGNRMAIAAVETAVWDLEAKLLQKPLWQHLGGTRAETNCGVSIGLQENTDVLLDKVRREVTDGYQRVKIKIKPGQDLESVKAARREFPEIALSVDANSAYRLETDFELLRRLDEYDLLMIEQPLAAGDILDHAKLQRELKTAVCLDESITDLREARQALEIKACRIVNIKLGRVGGHADARRIQELACNQNVAAWCGGMLETGIGRAHNIAMSTLPGFVLPGDVSASARYWDEDIIEPQVTVSENGTIAAPFAPGIGYAVDERRIEKLTVRNAVYSLSG